MGTRVGGTENSGGNKTERAQLRVLYDFEYETKGRRVTIKKDEKLLLVCKTNSDWWQVVRPGEINNSFVPESSTFFVPASYVVEIKENPLPDSTRFYVEKEKMFQETMDSDQGKDKSETSSTGSKSERKGHDSFRNVLKKFSGGGSSSTDSNSSGKPDKKALKNLKTTGRGSGKDAEVSTFGMCFGKSTEMRAQNPFQEELEHAITNRSHKRTVIDTKLNMNKEQQNKEQSQEESSIHMSSKTEKVQERWEKSIALALKKSEQFNSTSSRIIEDFEEKHRKGVISSEAKKEENPFDSIKLRSIKNIDKEVDKVPKKPPRILDKKLEVSLKPDPESNNHVEIIEDEKSEEANEDENEEKSVKSEKSAKSEKSEQQDLESNERLLKDKRKMWAIETLMAELMESAGKSKSSTTDNGERKGSSAGPIKLVQELHDMQVQVDLTNETKENDEEKEVSGNLDQAKNKVIFDFPPRVRLESNGSSGGKSPKQFDEYNEANILSDTEKTVIVGSIRKSNPTLAIPESPPPTYGVSLRSKRNKVPSKLRISPARDAHKEHFLASGRHSSETRSNEKHSLEIDVLDSTIASLSHDSLRLYKRRSKSDGALNVQDPYKLESSCHQAPTANAQCRSLETNKERRKYTQKNESRGPINRQYEFSQNPRRVREKLSSVGRSDRVSPATRYKLNRKSKSLGDLDSPGADEVDQPISYNVCNLKRRYKPVPKLRAKESLKKSSRSGLPPPPSPVRSPDTQLTKPVPAKRRVFAGPTVPLPENGNTSDSCEDFGEIDIERSTAVGFKALLRASESGSEEFLQYKTFPTKGSSGGNKDYDPGIFRSDGNVNLSGKTLSVDSGNIGGGSTGATRSLSDEMILKSAVSSVSAGLSTLDDTWTTCSSPTHDEGSTENLSLPPGWTQTYDNIAKRTCYVNNRGDKWFSSSDSEGKIYFFEENSNESSWALPPVIPTNRPRTVSNGEWPQLFDGNMYVIKEGTINKTKIMSENGKKFRKNWTTSYAVLTELFLLFFKDAKTFAAMKMDQSATAKPDISVDLNGASIESADRLSNRKNVYLISTLLGLQVLIQCDSPTGTAEWYHEIHNAIQKLPFSQEYRKSVPLRE